MSCEYTHIQYRYVLTLLFIKLLAVIFMLLFISEAGVAAKSPEVSSDSVSSDDEDEDSNSAPAPVPALPTRGRKGKYV